MNKNAIVTGVSSGIGHELAVQLIREHGYTVIGCARKEAPLRALEAQFNGRFIPIIGDVRDHQLQQALMDKALELGGLHLMINNAGRNLYSAADATDLTQARELLEINVIALTELTLRALPLLKQTRGTLVNMGSVNGYLAVPFNAIYTGSKHYVVGFTRGVHMDMRGSGVRVLTINPAGVDTHIHAAALDDEALGKKLNRSFMAAPVTKTVRSMLQQIETRRGPWVFPDASARLSSILGRRHPRLMDGVMGTAVRWQLRRLLGKRVDPA